MGLHSNIQVFIGGTPIPSFQQFMLHQEIGGHHELEMICRMDVLEGVSNDLADTTKHFLGTSFTLQVSALDGLQGYKRLEFKGVVTAIHNTKGFENRSGDTVTIRAKSSTILADDGPHYASYQDVSLQDILESNFASYDAAHLKLNIKEAANESVHYSVQQAESAWQYGLRLAAQYSIWCFYDGQTLHFGLPDDQEETALTYGHDLQEFSLALQPIPNQFNFFTNDYLKDEHHQATTAETPGSSGLQAFATDQSRKMYGRETNVWFNSVSDTGLHKRLRDQVQQQKKAADQAQVLVSGISDNPGLALGKVIAIKETGKHHGTYRVTRVTHTASENGRYQNHFEAVATGTDTYPLTNYNATPKSETQTAVVVDNADPEGMARVRVQLPWQKWIGATTPWLRIVTPHAGGDKGFHFIPEIGEEVLLGFEGGNAERPYVMGSLYHGSHRPQAWRTAKNDIKAMRTRSGHTLEFNDSDGGEQIVLTDPKGNLLQIDTVGETITINALKNININAGENINITAGKNIAISAGEDLSESGGRNVSVVAGKDMMLNASGNMTETSDTRQDIVDGDFSRQSATSDEYAKEITIFSAEDNLTVQSAKTVAINSAEKSKLF